jgi:transcriptional repressor NrdR
MKCPYCLSIFSKVTDKRISPDGIRRRRECLNCKRRFTTYEVVFKEDIYILKKNGKKERFDEEKLKKGIMKAFEKRPFEKKEIEKIVNEIETILRKKGKKEIKSLEVGEIVMKKIKKKDPIAYIRFASVYRNFENAKDFKNELKTMK